jgi:hypothetical protein
MEVHAHTHTERKKFTHYLWEFLMLFLAVFCGFLAENQREHIVENQREKKYMAMLYEDLKRDTAHLINDTTWWSNTIARIDTIRMEIEKPEKERNYLFLYRKAGALRNYNNFEYHDRTIQQLKNGGNFRLVKNKSIADSLTDYDAEIITALKDQEIQSNSIYQQVNFLQDKLINSKYFYLISSRTMPQLDSVFKKDPAVFNLFGSNPTDLMQYYNHLEFYKRMSRYRLSAMKILCRQAVNLIKMLEKDYHLK